MIIILAFTFCYVKFYHVGFATSAKKEGVQQARLRDALFKSLQH